MGTNVSIWPSCTSTQWHFPSRWSSCNHTVDQFANRLLTPTCEKTAYDMGTNCSIWPSCTSTQWDYVDSIRSFFAACGPFKDGNWLSAPPPIQVHSRLYMTLNGPKHPFIESSNQTHCWPKNRDLFVPLPPPCFRSRLSVYARGDVTRPYTLHYEDFANY